MVVPMLSPQQLGQLVSLAPALIAWLRQADENPGELFLNSQMDMDKVQSILRELLNAQNHNGDLNNSQLRYICSCHPTSSWVNAVRLILTECEPRLVSNEIGNALLAAMDKIQGAEDTEQVSHIIGQHIDHMPRSYFIALAEFCALIRDCLEDPVSLSMLVGPMLLAPRSGAVSPNASSASGTIMLILISEAESIFGRPGAKSTMPAFGVRKAIPKMQHKKSNEAAAGKTTIADQKSPSKENTEEARKARRIQQLAGFYQWIEPSRADQAPIIFENHDFEDIAHGIQKKYNMLPPGWKTDLADLKAKGSTKLDWFVDTGGGGGKGQAGRPNMPKAQGARPMSTRGATLVAKSNLDLTINEICDSEQSYHDILSELVESYVKTIRDISAGKKGVEAATQLGLSSSEVEKIFGWRLEDILRVSKTFLSKLEVVSLVRDNPKNPEGRQGLVADAFTEISNELHVYAPYVSAHKSSLSTLEKALKQMDDKAKEKKGGLLQRSRDKGSEMNFVKLWEVVSNGSQRLRGQTLQSLLINPIQRVPRYKLLLREVIKETPKDHPSIPKLTKADEVIGVAAKEINEALRQHEKLSKFFGDDEMLNPTTSALKAKNGKGGYAFKQGYVDGV